MDEDLKRLREAAKNEEPQPDDDDKTVNELRKGLDQLDAIIHVPTPSAAWIEQHIAATKNKQRSRLLRDLLLLWIGAMLIFYVFYLTVTAKPVAFISIQAAAILIPLTWLLLRKQVDSRGNNSF